MKRNLNPQDNESDIEEKQKLNNENEKKKKYAKGKGKVVSEADSKIERGKEMMGEKALSEGRRL